MQVIEAAADSQYTHKNANKARLRHVQHAWSLL